MKLKLILIPLFILINGILSATDNYGQTKAGIQKNREEHGAHTAIVTNNTSHDLKVALQFKNQASGTEEMITKQIPAEATEDEAVHFNKQGGLTAFTNAKFSVEVVTHRIGIHADNWTGEFTGKNMKLSHTFEYRPVVQNPIKIMSTIKLQMFVSFEGNIINIEFEDPYEHLDD